MRRTKEQNKRIIIKTAKELFKENGCDNISVNDICKTAKITRSTFYSVFDDKGDLITTLFNPSFINNIIQKEFNKNENDYERILSAYGSIIKYIFDIGPNMMRQIATIYLDISANREEHIIISELFSSFMPLIESCKKSGIIKNPNSADIINNIAINNFIGICYQWCMVNGEFDLYKKTLETLETIFDIEQQYRKYS